MTQPDVEVALKAWFAELVIAALLADRESLRAALGEAEGRVCALTAQLDHLEEVVARVRGERDGLGAKLVVAVSEADDLREQRDAWRQKAEVRFAVAGAIQEGPDGEDWNLALNRADGWRDRLEDEGYVVLSRQMLDGLEREAGLAIRSRQRTLDAVRDNCMWVAQFADELLAILDRQTGDGG